MVSLRDDSLLSYYAVVFLTSTVEHVSSWESIIYWYDKNLSFVLKSKVSLPFFSHFPIFWAKCIQSLPSHTSSSISIFIFVFHPLFLKWLPPFRSATCTSEVILHVLPIYFKLMYQLLLTLNLPEYYRFSLQLVPVVLSSAVFVV